MQKKFQAFWSWLKGLPSTPKIVIPANIALITLGIVLMAWAAVKLTGLAPTQRLIMFYIIAGAMSGLVGFGELISRYQDSPLRLFMTFATTSYIMVNIAAGIVALDIIRILHVLEPTGKDAPDPSLWLKQVLLASFGAIAFFRTSLFTVRVGGSDVGIGPSAMLQALLNTSDRMIDRDQAKRRAGLVKAILKDVDYRLARVPLPIFCLCLMTSVDQTELRKQIEALDDRKDMTDDSKIIVLGVYLLRVVGAEVLQRSVEALGALITKSGAPLHRQSEMATLMGALDYTRAKTALVDAVLAAVPSASQQDRDLAQQQVVALDGRKDITDEIKMMLLGAFLISIVGLDRLKGIVTAQGAAITK